MYQSIIIDFAQVLLFTSRSVIEQAVTDVLGSELCQLAVKVGQFFEQQKQQVTFTAF